MRKYYKIANDTTLYLNSSFNCIRANTLTFTLTNGGSGYVSVPSISVNSKTGDAGFGASLTCTINAGAINAITINNNGLNYNQLPDVVITGGGGTGAVITPSFLKCFEYKWIIPTLTINDLARLSVVNLIQTNFNANTPYVYRIKNLLYNNVNNYFSDMNHPIITMAQQNNVLTSKALGDANTSLTIQNQTLREIILSVDDSINSLNSGLDPTINFIIAIQIVEFNPRYEQITDAYGQAQNEIKNMY